MTNTKKPLNKYLDLVNGSYLAGVTLNVETSPYPIKLWQQMETMVFFDGETYTLTLHPSKSEGRDWLQDVIAPLEYLPTDDDTVKNTENQLVELKNTSELVFTISVKDSLASLPKITKQTIAGSVITKVAIEIPTAIGTAHVNLTFLAERPGVFALSEFVDKKFNKKSFNNFLENLVEGSFGASLTEATLEPSTTEWGVFGSVDNNAVPMLTDLQLIVRLKKQSAITVDLDSIKATQVTIEFKDMVGYIITIPMKREVTLELIASI